MWVEVVLSIVAMTVTVADCPTAVMEDGMYGANNSIMTSIGIVILDRFFILYHHV